MAIFYAVAGLNHFINPEFYRPLVPPYFRFIEEINLLAGVFEIIAAILVALPYPFSRRLGSYIIIGFLLAYIPSHMYFIEIGACVEDGLCVPVWVGWLRLLVIHPLLLLWAYIYRK
jgi:uncharacterized membrane protein